MTYQNPILLHVDGKRINVGDPFILRHDGRYYLYFSGHGNEQTLRCFTSTNLIDWVDEGVVLDDPVATNAYAPEVIYHHGRFLLVTSPKGHGHYLYEANSPLGPFYRKTDNLNHMIDGSFYKENGILYFLRADHNGITLHEVTEDLRLVHRIDLDAPLYGWTEGPFLIKHQNRYFLTYCGNHLVSRGYRVEYSVADKIEGPYRKTHLNPLLLSTKDELHAVGHSSIVRGPNLIDWYNVYHHLTENPDGSHNRNLCIDRLDFNGSLMKQAATYRKTPSPDGPTWLSRPPHSSLGKDRAIPLPGAELVAMEFHLHPTEGDVVELDDVTVRFVNERLELHQGDHLVDAIHYPLSWHKETTILLERTDGWSITVNQEGTWHLDQEHFKTVAFPTFDLDRLGALSYQTSRITPPLQPLGGPVFLQSEQARSDLSSAYDVHLLAAGQSATASIDGRGSYHVAMFGQVLEDSDVLLTWDGGSQEISLPQRSHAYEHWRRPLGILDCSSATNLKIQVLRGRIELVYLFLEELNRHEPPRDAVDRIHQETYRLVTSNEVLTRFSTTIDVHESHPYRRFGLVVRAREYSDHPFQTKFPLLGTFIGFYHNLLVVDRLHYGNTRLYDIPFDVPASPFELSCVMGDGTIDVYVDGIHRIHVEDPYMHFTGQYGTYANELCHITFHDTKGERQ